MVPGSLLDGRFEVGALAGFGGMGTVYRAVDRASGKAVALKLLHDTDAQAAERFLHEARALASVAHPHIVRYVAHGVTPAGAPYLVMEWLSGETLAERIPRAGLCIEESLRLARHVADALGAAHARGVVHRDIKPSNLFLVDRDVDQVMVLDFGVAHLSSATTRLTRTGAVLGTPGYMAPEQARGGRTSIDARADVFSLGAVLFECLTGRPAFQGKHAMALLARLLLEDQPRLREIRPEVPPALDELVARMLAKDPAMRPDDGAAVVRCLDGLGEASGDAASSCPAAADVITSSEARLYSIVAVRCADDHASAAADTVLLDVQPRSLLAEVQRAATAFGARVDMLLDGTVVAWIVGTESATDQAARAARCALHVRARLSDVRVVLVTGRGEDTGKQPLGEVLERAAALLGGTGAKERAAREAVDHVGIDRVTQALLDVRFEVTEEEGQLRLRAEHEIGDEARRLLGRPSPFVGRDRELRSLLELVEESFEERRAAVALVTAPAGMGKSRLRHELTRALRQRYADLDLAMYRGDSIGAGSAYAMLAGALRNTLGLSAGEPLEARRQKLSQAVGQSFAGEEGRRVTEFLGELLDTPFPDEDRPHLRAARQNPAIMAERIQEAYIDWARAKVGARPMLVVLEDLHWGDAPSVAVLDRALRALADRPYVVLAFARPAVHDLFPRLWAGRALHEIPLRELPTRAAERLVRSALGESIDASAVKRLAERAHGNAFFLEELIRAVAEGRGDALPETVLGMVEARLSALGPEARRFLRAASVFGEVFWPEGVHALLGTAADGTAKAALTELIAREIIAPRSRSRFEGTEEMAFRHALLREGAYAMLTDRDRALGHELAGEWLLGVGEQDPMLLAEHFERSRERKRAVAFYLGAAEQALRAADVPAVLARAQKGMDCGAEGEMLAGLLILRMSAFFWDDQQAQGHACASAILEIAPLGSPAFWQAMTYALSCVVNFADRRAIHALIPRLSAAEPTLDARVADQVGRIVFALLWEGIEDLPRRYMRRLEEDIVPHLGNDRYAAAWLEFARGIFHGYAERDPWKALQHYTAATATFEALGDFLNAPIMLVLMAHSNTALGDNDAAHACLDRVLSFQRPLRFALSTVSTFRIVALLEQGRPEEALEPARALLEMALAGDDVGRIDIAHLLLAQCHLLRGELSEAEAHERALGDPERMIPHLRAIRLSIAAELKLRQGCAGEAAALAGKALSWHERSGGVFLALQEEIPVRYAEALHAKGDMAAAVEAIRRARADLLSRAEKIPDLALRRSFLEGVPAHARTLALSRAWLGAHEDIAEGPPGGG
jgi:tetratricopeptide (TPR) repeat protein